ncbi:hypothetical protein T4D_6854 [Trichinella pseudospiralis]|uniref:Uncharacterized protein n=1 Tax=Trichinella pseudospiralis TaxID=6337 RepID=A0A0V1F713_TRIPS|nr:hypothetical protein T4D_6854 [Trichinella pseudospiralis]
MIGATYTDGCKYEIDEQCILFENEEEEEATHQFDQIRGGKFSIKFMTRMTRMRRRFTVIKEIICVSANSEMLRPAFPIYPVCMKAIDLVVCTDTK